MSTHIEVTRGMLVVEPVGIDQVLAVKRRIEVPIGKVRGATHDPGAAAEFKGLRAPGLALPGKWAGTFHRDNQRYFWNVGDAANTVVVQLAEAQYDRLYLSVEDPRAVVDMINAAIVASSAERSGERPAQESAPSGWATLDIRARFWRVLLGLAVIAAVINGVRLALLDGSLERASSAASLVLAAAIAVWCIRKIRAGRSVGATRR